MPLYVIEGIDGCGKETQIRLLKDQFPDVVLFKYPTRVYPILNDYLEKKVEIDSKALFLLFLSDIANEQKKVQAALDAGKRVVLDRYVFSTIAYEVNEGITYAHGKKIIEAIGYIKPDKVLLLDINADISQERKKKQKQLDRYEENKQYLEKVRNNFLKLAKDRFLTDSWHTIDASRSAELVSFDVLRLLE